GRRGRRLGRRQQPHQRVEGRQLTRQQPARLGPRAIAGHGVAAHAQVARDAPIGLAHAQASYQLANVGHGTPPSSHRASLGDRLLSPPENATTVDRRKESAHGPAEDGSIWPPLGGSLWATLTGSAWATPGGSASPTPVAHYRAAADIWSVPHGVRRVARPPRPAAVEGSHQVI